MRKSVSFDNRAALDIVNIVAGLGLALSPLYLGYTAESYAAWNAWIVGGIIALIAITAVYAFHQAQQWANIVLGLWTVVAPWALGFTGLSGALTAHVIAGLVVAIAAAVNTWISTNRPYSTA